MADAQTERAACPLYTALGVIEGRWKAMLFQRLSEQPRGLGALQRAMPGLSRKVLIEQLRQMEADDLLVRHEMGDRLGSIEYRLTEHGRALGPVFEALWLWGRSHLARSDAGKGTLVPPPRSRTA
jgi:DNA-binding HxlR family transcriptional regulator